MDFVTIDVETANNPASSICQVGLAKYVNGDLVDVYSSLVLPNYDFNKYNVAVHGITEDMVADAPSMTDIYDELLAFIGSNVLVSYTNFDKRSLRGCAAEHNLPAPQMLWADANLMVKKKYPDLAKQGSGLAKVCNAWGFNFGHHDALEDAKACGFITTRILREHNSSIHDWATK